MVVISFQQSRLGVRLFHRSNRGAFGFLLALLFSILLIVADGRYGFSTSMRRSLSVALSSLEHVAALPRRLSSQYYSLIQNSNSLMKENQRLREQQLLLSENMLRFESVVDENNRLKALSALADASVMHSSVARVLVWGINNPRQVIILDKGRRDHVYVGQPVMDESGLLGQVIDVGSMTCTVLLISDAVSAVSVRNNRTGETSILMGLNDMDHMRLIHLPKTSQTLPDDLLVTSGLDRRCPGGYPVGIVKSMVNDASDDFIKVGVKPLAAFNRSQLVLLVWPNQQHAMFSAEIDERLGVLKERYS